MDATEAFEARALGDIDAISAFLPLVYNQLRAVAGHLKGERPGQALRPTELVHEAYLRLVDRSRVSWQGKTHFMAVAAIEMRRILVDSARAQWASKRWGALHRVTFDDGAGAADAVSLDVLAVHEALERLAELRPGRRRPSS